MPPFGYIRKSVSKDPTREVSREVQEQAVRSLAARHGDDPDSMVILADWGVSGQKNGRQRPGYSALLAAIADGRCTSLYSYNLSRLARSVQELTRLVADCKARDIPIRLAADSLDTSTASGMLLFHVLAALAQFTSDLAREAKYATDEARRSRGLKPSATPLYGERPGESPAAVLDAFRAAGSYAGAAKILNASGLKPRQGRVWWPSSVRVVVRRLDPSVPSRPETRGYRAGGSPFLLARLLTCPTCGTRLTGSRGPRDRVRYVCKQGTSQPHPRQSVSERSILPAIQHEVARLRPPDQVKVAEADAADRAALDRRRDRIIDTYIDQKISKAERDRRLAVVDEATAALDVKQVVVKIPIVDWDWPARDLCPVLQSLFEKIELDPATFQPVTFTWTVPEWRR